MALSLAVDELEVTGEGGRRILAIEHLATPAGSCLGVKGPSGAGKSTFLFAIAGLLKAAKGRVSWGETEMTALPQGARARFRREHFGFVFQDPLLFEEMGASANASLAAAFLPKARRNGVRATADDALRTLSVPRGRRRADTFSGGERQRIALARALAADAGVILADEPTASLDRQTRDRLVGDLMELVRKDGKSLIAVSHDVDLLGVMDRVVTIENGALVAA